MNLIKSQTRQVSQGNPEQWLLNELKTANAFDENTQKPVFPLKMNGEHFEIKDLKTDQKEILGIIMEKMKEFMLCHELKSFQPLRMIIQGAGGSGKSVLINTLVTVMRRMFNDNDVVRVVAPTGAAAFNVGGETIHSSFSIPMSRNTYEAGSMNAVTQQQLKQRLKRLLALIIDERSMLNSEVFGTACQMTSETIFEGHNSSTAWGGLPILILVGDDYQLPPIEKGALYLDSHRKNKMQTRGDQEFLECSRQVYELTGSKRIIEGQDDDKALMNRVRIGKPSMKDVEKIQSLQLNRYKYNQIKKAGRNPTEVLEEIKEIKKNAIYLFSRNDDICQHNISAISAIQDALNPCAFVKSQSRGIAKRPLAVTSHFNPDEIRSQVLCRGAKVALANRNFCPSWGLHNGAVGTVEDVVFHENETPKEHLPRYVIVHFPAYVGPIWDKKNPKSIPIPCVPKLCKFKCCERTFLPLVPAFARSIHKFQGMSAGPTGPGQIPNMFPHIICHPGDSTFEGNNPGTLYVAISRATTLGDHTGKGSAIYFIDDSVPTDRVLRLRHKKNNKELFEKIQLRDSWMQRLDEGKQKISIQQDDLDQITKWSTETNYSKEEITNRIHQYTQLTSKPYT